MNEGILSAIGHTPLVRLKRALKDINFRLFAKLESLNPGGSMKDRPAFNILAHAMESGEIKPGAVIIESSSGNMGIGLAQACVYYGLQFICVVDMKTTMQNIRLLEAYGAKVDVVTAPDPVSGEYLKARIDRVHELLATVENSYWPNQYSNLNNSNAHHQTMHEVITALGNDVDYVFCATSTCGTIRGCAEYLRDYDLKTKVIAVDAVGSVIFDSHPAKRLIPGHGASIMPQLFQPNLASECVQVTDLDCVVGCRRLVRREAILAGGSSGGLLMAVAQIKYRIPDDATCVIVLPDRGERYLDTVYSDEWVTEHFGDISHLWQDSVEERECTMVES